jgi:hypothetical protein
MTPPWTLEQLVAERKERCREAIRLVTEAHGGFEEMHEGSCSPDMAGAEVLLDKLAKAVLLLEGLA